MGPQDGDLFRLEKSHQTQEILLSKQLTLDAQTNFIGNGYDLTFDKHGWMKNIILWAKIFI
jgi:hypothetical protein